MSETIGAKFYELVSGRRRGVGATLARGALRLAETPYSLAMRWRNRQYDNGGRAIERVGVPVISVGNLTLGGTGKTPMVEWLCRWFRAHGKRVTIVSRGYKAGDGATNDEALELEQKLPDVPHVQNPDRVAAARMAIEEFEAQAIVLDDAFQHRRIARDLDIVLLDALAPFGFEHVFPRGTLREPLSGLGRAHVVVLTRADMATPAERDRIAERVKRLAPAHCGPNASTNLWRYVQAVAMKPRWMHFAASASRHFVGIGNPAGFRHTLATCGYEVSLFREFADHHAYSRGDVESLSAWAENSTVAAVLCTHKDLVKLGLDRLGDKPLWAVRIGLEFISGEDELSSRVRQAAP